MVGAAKDASGVWVDVDVDDLGVVGASEVGRDGYEVCAMFGCEFGYC